MSSGTGQDGDASISSMPPSHIGKFDIIRNCSTKFCYAAKECRDETWLMYTMSELLQQQVRGKSPCFADNRDDLHARQIALCSDLNLIP